jgi:archaellum component FlaC
MSTDWGAYSVAVNCIELVAIFMLIVLARRSTAPALERRVTELEGENHTMRGNVTRIDRDLNAVIRARGDAEDHIMRELDGIKEMLQGKVSIRRQFEVLADQVADLKTTVQAMPCMAAGAPADCPEGGAKE